MHPSLLGRKPLLTARIRIRSQRRNRGHPTIRSSTRRHLENTPTRSTRATGTTIARDNVVAAAAAVAAAVEATETGDSTSTK